MGVLRALLRSSTRKETSTIFYINHKCSPIIYAYLPAYVMRRHHAWRRDGAPMPKEPPNVTVSFENRERACEHRIISVEKQERPHEHHKSCRSSVLVIGRSFLYRLCIPLRQVLSWLLQLGAKGDPWLNMVCAPQDAPQYARLVLDRVQRIRSRPIPHGSSDTV